MIQDVQNPASLILERRKIRRSFEEWCKYRMKKVGREPAKHHLLIIKTIDMLLRGELSKRKVMILTPPGTAKSTYTSMLLPAWFCNPEKFPRELMLACSYSYNLVEGFGKQALNIVKEEKNVLGLTLSGSSCAAGDWRTTEGGGYWCGGVGTGVAGHRAKLGLIDDYLGLQEDADSETIREKQWQWYWNDFMPRLLPNESWEFIIANRRHEDDLVGRLLEKEADKWLVIKLPFFAGPNDPLGRPEAPLGALAEEELTPEVVSRLRKEIVATRLWPEWFSEEKAYEVLDLPDLRMRSGLWGQEPVGAEGNFFKKADLVGYQPYDLPGNLRIYAASDWAVRSQDLSDRTCHIYAGLDDHGNLWILPDWFWKTCDTGEGVNAMFAMNKRRQPIFWWHGRENITGSIGPFIYEKMRNENNYINIVELPESKNKETKAGSFRARCGAKTVMFPKYAPTWDQAEKEILAFPAGKHDDFPDTLSKFGMGLLNMVKADKQPEEGPKGLPQQELTCGWVVESHNRRQKQETFVRC